MAKDNKTLHLVLKRKWWEMIDSGEKTWNRKQKLNALKKKDVKLKIIWQDIHQTVQMKQS